MLFKEGRYAFTYNYYSFSKFLQIVKISVFCGVGCDATFSALKEIGGIEFEMSEGIFNVIFAHSVADKQDDVFDLIFLYVGGMYATNETD